MNSELDDEKTEALLQQSKNSSLFSYKGPVSGLKGLLTNKIAEGLASVVSTIDRFSESNDSEKLEGGTEKIAIEKIYPCADQPRQVFDPKSLEELSATMKELGQAQAITVRKTDNGYEIVSGERRYRAAKLAGLTHLDCVVKDCDLREARLLALVENIQRQDLLPIEEAHFMKKVLQENPDLSLERLARMLGSHKSTLSEKIQLTEIPEEMQGLLYAKGKSFTHRHWRVISRIADTTFLRETLMNAVENQLSVAELERSLEAAGVKKAVRKKKDSIHDDQLSFQNMGVLKREGRNVRFRAMTIDLEKLSSENRNNLVDELEGLLADLRTLNEKSSEMPVDTVSSLDNSAT